uniref:HAUS augmin like complex subunit 3 n=1 Tax=Leptobrachium leishanense TaxID=445787 RepID=A0A8C5LT93_9ANUR
MFGSCAPRTLITWGRIWPCQRSGNFQTSRKGDRRLIPRGSRILWSITMDRGGQLVQTLQKAGYPKAPQLDGEDFDWLFDTTDAKSFLDWFCGTVSEHNVISDEKLQAFNELKESGKAVLDEKAVREVLKTCETANSKMAAMEEVAIEKLEEEVEALKKLRNLRIRRRNKLQMIASANNNLTLKMGNLEEADAKKLRETVRALEATNKNFNRELGAIVQSAQALMSFFTIPDEGCELSSPTFLFQVLLENFFFEEEQHTASLSSLTKEHFGGNLSEGPLGSENVQELLQVPGDPSASDPDVKIVETMKLNLAYISAKHKLIQSKATRVSLEAGLKWAENYLSAAPSKVTNKENLQSRILSLDGEIAETMNHIDVLKGKNLVELVRQNAQLLNIPIMKGEYDAQRAWQDLHSKKQDILCARLLKQKASLEVLQMGYELELKKHREVYMELTAIIEELNRSANGLDERLTMMSDPSLVSSSKPRSNIDSKDSATHRLYQVLDGDQTQKLFRTYNGLESAAQKLAQDVVTLKDQLAVAEQEQVLLLSKLNADLKSLQGYMCPGGKELLLSTPEVANLFQQLDSQLEKLNHVLVGVLDDLKVKRKILQSNKMQHVEKQLYVYFFQNEGLLRNVVEKVESQADNH